MEACRVTHNGKKVVLIVNGQGVEMPRQVAEMIAKGLLENAAEVKEIEERDQVALDHGILLRAGSPFGIAQNPKIRAQAENDALWHPTLRKMPGGVKATTKIGVPSIVPRSTG